MASGDGIQGSLLLKRYDMLIQDQLALTRAEPNGQGGTQFLYRVDNYGIAAISRPQEDHALIHWEVDVVKYLESGTFQYEVCHTTKLADKTLKFHDDKILNEFLQKAFDYFKELNLLEKMLPEDQKL